MAWHFEATSHYLSQCWSRTMASLGLNELIQLAVYSTFNMTIKTYLRVSHCGQVISNGIVYLDPHWIWWCLTAWLHQAITWISVEQLATGPQGTNFSEIWIKTKYMSRADSRVAPSQWETSLQSNAVSHWVGVNLESALHEKMPPAIWMWFCSGLKCVYPEWLYFGVYMDIIQTCCCLGYGWIPRAPFTNMD